MKQAPPRWDCHSAADIERLKAWTLAQLAREEIVFTDSEYAAAVEKNAAARLEYNRLIQAVRSNDYQAVEKYLDDHPDRRRWLLKLILKNTRVDARRGNDGHVTFLLKLNRIAKGHEMTSSLFTRFGNPHMGKHFYFSRSCCTIDYLPSPVTS